MANILNQVVTQDGTNGLPKRIIVQYYDNVAEVDKQTITNYDDMTAGEKTDYDAFIALSESKMI